MSESAKPTDDTIALVAFLLGTEEGQGRWFYADEIRHAVKRLGFRMPSSQWITGHLVAMTEESAPRFERKQNYAGISVYRVTHWAATGLENQWKGFRHWGEPR